MTSVTNSSQFFASLMPFLLLAAKLNHSEIEPQNTVIALIFSAIKKNFVLKRI